jgi:endonuclease/exonuclease/phosphatase family metal-dependent hydrolase
MSGSALPSTSAASASRAWLGEIVIPDEELQAADALLKRQFARTPYCVSFKSGGDGFTLVTLHILWGKSAAGRTPELHRIAQWFAEHAQDPDDFNRNMIALGDFNIDRRDDPNWKAFVVDYGLFPSLRAARGPAHGRRDEEQALLLRPDRLVQQGKRERLDPALPDGRRLHLE